MYTDRSYFEFELNFENPVCFPPVVSNIALLVMTWGTRSLTPEIGMIIQKEKDKDLPNYSITDCRENLQYLGSIIAHQDLVQHYSSYAFNWYIDEFVPLFKLVNNKYFWVYIFAFNYCIEYEFLFRWL